jgi:hypothetical protein
VLKDRLRGLRAVADQTVVVRHVPPAEQRRALLADHCGDEIPDRFAIARVARQEHQARTIRACLRKRERNNLAKERVRRLDQNAGAVARVRLAPARAAMLQVDEHLHRLAHDCIRLASLDVDDEADATGVALVIRVVETLPGRRKVVRIEHAHILTSLAT